MPSLNAKDIFNLTAEMYQCAAGAHDIGWLSIYEKLSTLLSSGPGSIHFLDKTKSRFEAFADTNEPGFVDRFNEQYFRSIQRKKRSCTSLRERTFYAPETVRTIFTRPRTFTRNI